ncbi:hypothetical protein [Streptomyces canus]|uniref:hypothetical protein n=1 Tax=Streptomyces canus TaxID=58343 RepID=UPI0027868910|nr:hypothetical protein [Streptomyces canus]MDQ0762048.1 hypothetical protein [Streptomyces canus]
MTTPPAVGKNASVKVDAQMYDDLEVMLSTGMTLSDAVRSALLIVAGVYRKVWDAGAVPARTRPTIERFWITRCDPGQWPGRGTAQTTVPTAYRLRPTPGPRGVTARPTPGPPGATARPTDLPSSYPVLPAGVTRPVPSSAPVRPDGPAKTARGHQP